MTLRARRRTAWIAGALAAAAVLARAQDFATYHGDPIPPEVEAAYVRGLNFLAKSQSSDGSWQESGGEGQAGVAGLAMLAVLAHGDDPNFGSYAATVRRAAASSPVRELGRQISPASQIRPSAS